MTASHQEFQNGRDRRERRVDGNVESGVFGIILRAQSLLYGRSVEASLSQRHDDESVMSARGVSFDRPDQNSDCHSESIWSIEMFTAGSSDHASIREITYGLVVPPLSLATRSLQLRTCTRRITIASSPG
jgi:hypothetical protein